jgi:hypothetical protein
MPLPPTKTSPLFKTPTCSSTLGRRGTRSATTPLPLFPIASTLDAAVTTTASASMESVEVYLVIAVSARIDIVRE